LSLFFGGTLEIDGSGSAIGTLVHIWNMLGGLVVAYDVLPGVALLAEDGITVIVREAADALDRGGFLLECPIECGRAVRAGGWCGLVVEDRWSWLRFSVRRDGRDVGHNLAGTLNKETVWWYCGWLRLYVLWIA
jgi:hypothetical protein